MAVTETGMLAKSIAGHDKGEIYVILRMDGEWLELVNGRNRTLANPKKKQMKHVQIIKECYQDLADDIRIRNILKEYTRRQARREETKDV